MGFGERASNSRLVLFATKRTQQMPVYSSYIGKTHMAIVSRFEDIFEVCGMSSLAIEIVLLGRLLNISDPHNLCADPVRAKKNLYTPDKRTW